MPETTITACILARNEARRIEAAIGSLTGWTDQLIILDNESEDATAEIARRYTEHVLTIPRSNGPCFDGLRNRAIAVATGDWIFYLDADERVPERLGQTLRRLVRERGEEFEALVIPFRHYFCGRWVPHAFGWPGYTRPQLLKKGCFHYGDRVHSGVEVEGRTSYFPASDPELAIVHHSYDDLHHYLEKLNRYTDGEAESLLADGHSHGWQAMLAHFVHDWQAYYEARQAGRDGMHGFVLSFFSAFYRFAARAKLWDLRCQHGDLTPAALARDSPSPQVERGLGGEVPRDLREMLEFMAHVVQHGAAPYLQPSGDDRPPTTDDRAGTQCASSPITPAADQLRVGHQVEAVIPIPQSRPSSVVRGPSSVPLLWRAPLLDPSGYADEARSFVLGLIEAGEEVAVAPECWGSEDAGLEPAARAAIEERAVPADTPAGIFVSHTLPLLQEPSPRAAFNVARTMFETDRLPARAAERLNAFDRIWVPSEFNRETFVRSGVDPTKIAVIPGAIAPAFFDDAPLPEDFSWIRDHAVRDLLQRRAAWILPDTQHPRPNAQCRPFVFLSVFDWTLHKGWDVLLEAFALEFGVPAIENAKARKKGNAKSRGRTKGGAVSEPGPGSSASSPVAGLPANLQSSILNSHSSISARTKAPGHQPEVTLLLKIWSSNHYTLDDIRAHANAFLEARVGRPLSAFPNIHLWQAWIPQGELPRLYRAVDAYVTPTRGEGWCRPLMEAMASGLPTIATAWSGLTAFHNAKVGYPLKYSLAPVSEAGAREIPLYAGHCWAEPEVDDLRRLLRRIIDHGEEARRRGRAARQAVAKRYSREAVTTLLRQELAHCRTVAGVASHPSLLVPEPGDPGSAHSGVSRSGGRGEPPARPNGGSQPPNSSLPPAHHAAPPDLGGTSNPPPPVRSICNSQSSIFNHQSPASPALPAPSFRPPARLLTRDSAPAVDFRALLGRPLRVRWEGDQSILSSLALVNREFCLGLLAAGDVELTLVENRDPWHTLTGADDPRFAALFARRDASLSGPPDVTIRHHFPPNWQRPAAGRLIVIQPWEYAYLPREWVAAARQADEVWAYSRFVRDVYVRSGVPAEKVRVVPLGFDPEVFTPHGPGIGGFHRRDAEHAEGEMDVESDPVKQGVGEHEGLLTPLAGLPPSSPISAGSASSASLRCTGAGSQSATRFLFVGGALDRKGADLLLRAYLAAFTRADDVLLVVKDMGTRTFYQGQTFADAFRQAVSEPRAPAILYLDDDLSGEELASLYRTCSCVVLPYRGEGFALPPLEGMACGLPAIVTAGGPTDDYCDDTTALRLPYRRRSRPDQSVGPFACAGDCPLGPWDLEPDPDALVAALRWVRDHPEEARRRGEAAREHAAAHWTWSRAVAEARARLREVAAPSRPAAPGPVHIWHDPIRTTTDDGPQTTSNDQGKPGGSQIPNTEGRTAQGAPDTERRPPNRAERRRAGHHGPLPPAPAASPPVPQSAIRIPQSAISLCLIARNEERCIRECLESIRPYVDEMVVVDTGSTDRTRAIAGDCGARVFEFPWVDDFAAARNASLEQARGDWIFWMDADDVIFPECGRQLRELVRAHPERDTAFQMPVHIPPKKGQFSPQRTDHVKLFPNRPGLRFEHRIHEQILPSIRRAGLELISSDVYVTHQNYDTSEAGQRTKRLRDFRLLKLDLAERPEHPFVLFNLGMTYLHATKDFEVAAHYLRRSLDRSDPNDSIVHIAYGMLCTCRIHQGDWEAAIQVNEEGRRHHPSDPELLFLAGQIYQQLGRFQEGRLALERLVSNKDEPRYRTGDAGLRTYRGWHELALLYRRMGDPAHCVQVLRRLAREHPFYLPAQADLAETLAQRGRAAEADAVLAAIPDDAGIRDEVARLRQLLAGARGVVPPVTAARPAPDADHFDFQGRRFPYFRHVYNGAGTNERTVEVSLALAAVEQAAGAGARVLEIGNVLGHYGVSGHTVVDRYESGNGVLNVDVADYQPEAPFDLIVSVSTLEHVGWDEDPRDAAKVARVLERLTNGMLAAGGALLATAPLGYNPHLDRLILEEKTGTRVAFLRRIDEENQWREVPRADLGTPEYGRPFPQGNVVAVLTR